MIASKESLLKMGLDEKGGGCNENIFVQDYFLELSLAYQGAVAILGWPPYSSSQKKMSRAFQQMKHKQCP